MPDDYKNLTAGELDELIAQEMLNLVLMLVEADVPREQTNPSLTIINAAVAELVLRADNNFVPRDEIDQIKRVLLDLSARVDALGGGEENSD